MVVGLALPQPIGAEGEYPLTQTFGFYGPDPNVGPLRFHQDAYAMTMRSISIDPAFYPTMNAALRYDVQSGVGRQRSWRD